MANDEPRVVGGFFGAQHLVGAEALAALREAAESALRVPYGEHVVDREGVHRVSLIPHDVATELIQRIDHGDDSEEVFGWMMERMHEVGRIGADEAGPDNEGQ